MTEIKAEFNRNPDGSWMSADQIFEDVVNNRINDARTKEIIAHNFNFGRLATDEERQQYATTDFNPYAFMYHDFGRWLRNTYGLWVESNPHTNARSEGTDDPKHPDNFSGMLIDRLRKHYAKELGVA